MILFANIPLVGREIAEVPIYLRERKGLKRVTMSFSTKDRQVIITAPTRTPRMFLHTFIETHKSWIEKQAEHILPEAKTFSAGVIVPFQGKKYILVNEISNKVLVVLDKDTLFVRAATKRIDTHVRRWLITKVTEIFNDASIAYAKILDVSISKITIKAMHSRWGSCSSDGNLNYNWRLIFAPEEILHYVCAHEVSHLIHMNHSKEFWQTVETLYPEYKTARNWLKTNGTGLYLFG